MTKKKIYLMCGVPASGKTTYIKQRLYNGDMWISRDIIRFSYVKKGEDYFSKENLVFASWIRVINENLSDPKVKNIYLDATHISPESRYKTLSRLNLENCESVTAVNIIAPLDICLERNSKRTGREKVPEKVIKNMYNNFVLAEESEKFIDNVISISV